MMQHHDAVTGTEKQHVTDAYSRELHASIVNCEMNTKSSLNQFTTNRSENVTEWKFNFTNCLTLNISTCDVTESSPRFVVTVYNPLSHTVSQYVRFAVANFNYEIRDSSNKLMRSQFLPTPASLVNLHYRSSTSIHELLFYATEIPPVGYKSFYVTRLTTAEPVTTETPTQSVTVGADEFKVTFTNGLLSAISIDGASSELSQNFFYYTGANMNNEIFANRSSGAYIFRPAPNTSETIIGTDVQLTVIRGDLVDEVHQIFSDWISQVVRIYKTERYIEFEWLVGPIDTDDNIAKEIVSRFTTNIKSESVFYTDSNGRDMMKRKRGERETWDVEMLEEISGNYYPVTTRIAIEDVNYRLAVFTDRAEGGSSLIDGTVELMVRNCGIGYLKNVHH